MNTKNRALALFVSLVIVVSVLAGCAQSPTAAMPTPEPLVENAGHVEIHDPADSDVDQPEEGLIDLSLEMVPLASSPAMFAIPTTVASGVSVSSNSKAVIDYSNSADGYVMIKYISSASKVKVRITGPSGTQYQYVLKTNGEYEVFPLSDGNGSYKIEVFRHVEGSQYAPENVATISVNLTDEFAPFLRPNQYVNFTQDSQTVKKAAELISGKSDFMDQVAAIYEYVIKNISYDYDLAKNVTSGYVPNVDSVLKKGKGICFDYAAVMASMLRSQGIPTKLVVGYTGSAYHAWINVYSPETGWVNSVIYFDGKGWKLMDPTFASTGGQSKAAEYIGDGKNYKAKYLY